MSGACTVGKAACGVSRLVPASLQLQGAFTRPLRRVRMAQLAAPADAHVPHAAIAECDDEPYISKHATKPICAVCVAWKHTNIGR